MKLRVGEAIRGADLPVGTGINGAVHTTVRVEGRAYRAILKRMPRDAVLAECFSGLLLRAYGLPVPEPILVQDGENLAVASLEVTYPNLMQRMGWREGLSEDCQKVLLRAASEIVCDWSDAPTALALDELIANGDRNLSNLLWDGESHAYIDHEHTLDRVPHGENKLAVMAQHAERTDAMQAGAVSAALAFDRDIPTQIESPPSIDFAAFCAFIQARLPLLANRVLERFPQPDDLFSRVVP